MFDKKVKVKEIRDLGSRNYLLTLNAAEQAALTRPGQFFMLKCVERIDENPLLRRPLSAFNIHRHPRSGKPAGLDFLIKDIGNGTHKLANLMQGDEIYCLGPQGHWFQAPAESQSRISHAYLVAGGVGIAALYLLAQNLVAQDVRPVLIYGGRNVGDLVLRDYFERLGIETAYTTEDGSCGERGVVTLALERFLKVSGRREARIYACGPWEMMKAVHELSLRYRLPCDVSLEARMGCSLGACMGCVIRASNEKGESQYIRVCQEGPVMSSRIVDWETRPI
ncbi:MAG: pyrK [Acidobacteria bacterium]|nr:pyrK [Acidobacteriota bacterium]